VKSKTAENHIKITCRGADLLPLEVIEEFQGTLKKRTKRDIERIIKSIQTTAFRSPFSCGRITAEIIVSMDTADSSAPRVVRPGVPLPQFPVAYIDAADEQEARQKLLSSTANMADAFDSVMKFAAGLEVEWDDLSLATGRMTIIGKLPEPSAMMSSRPT
jgi:hypothetical protein